jgi:hypothetical protein
VHGQIGSRESCRSGILSTNTPSQKGLDVRLWITIVCRRPVEETTAIEPSRREYTPVIGHLSVGTSGDMPVEIEVLVAALRRFVESMPTPYSNVGALYMGKQCSFYRRVNRTREQ